MSHLTKIRAALDAAIAYPNSTHAELKAHDALAALAELEKSAAAQFEAVEVDDAMCKRVLARFFDALPVDSADEAHTWIAAVQAELGPTLGLVPLREPTPEECGRIAYRYSQLGLSRNSTGRKMFDAVRAVMLGESGDAGG